MRGFAFCRACGKLLPAKRKFHPECLERDKKERIKAKRARLAKQVLASTLGRAVRAFLRNQGPANRGRLQEAFERLQAGACEASQGTASERKEPGTGVAASEAATCDWTDSERCGGQSNMVAAIDAAQVP